MIRLLKNKFLLALSLLGLLVGGCGTTTGNSFIVSEAFSPESFTSFNAFALDDSGFLNRPLTNFKLCVKKIRLQPYKSERSDGPNDDITFEAGLIDLTSTNQVEWGQVNVPTGFQLSKLQVHLHRDAELCKGFEHALQFNDHTVTDNVVLKFRFYPAVDLEDGATLKLSVQSFARQLLHLDSEGLLSSGNLKNYTESIEDTASKSE